MSETELVEDLLDIWLKAYEGGRDTPVAELCAARPDLAAAVASRIEDVRPLAMLSREINNPLPPTRLGKFQLVERLARGGMAEVYRARDTALGRDVALKVLRLAEDVDPAAAARFLREARAAASVRHDNVVEIYHVGEDNGRAFLVMPVLQGEGLDARLAREKVLPPAEVARIGREAAEGLAAAHAAGLVHRDIKPSNLWLESPTGRVKVFDFGLARLAGGSDSVTTSGTVMGTLAYMSPERARGEAVDGRSDLFSLGAVLYEAATGQPAFTGNTQSAILSAVASHHPPPPHKRTRAVPPALSALIMRMLSKSPDDRPTTAREVADTLAESADAAMLYRSPRRWRWVVVAVLLVVAVLIWVLTR